MNVPGCLIAVGYLLTIFVAARIAYVRLDRSGPDGPDNGICATAIGAYTVR
jgi:hypothetical protein